MSTDYPTIIPRPDHTISRKWISPNAVRVLYRLKEGGYLAYLVGGGVRDLLLGREPKDFDIATDATPGEVKKLFRNCRLIGRRFRLAHVYFHNEIIEVATFRSQALLDSGEAEAAPVEQPPGPQAAVTSGAGEPAVAVPPRPRPPRMLKTEDGMILRDNVFGTPGEDAVRRDFTVNALFYNIADFSVIDYVGGVDDLRRGLIRIIGDPEVRFTEDPVRIIRAVRFAAMLGFAIEENTYRAMLALRDRVALASHARLYEETLKLFLLGEGEKTYQLLRKTGLFGVLFPRLNEWVDTEAEGFPHTRIGKAFEWVDACVQAGRQPATHVLFALVIGHYLEERAAELQRKGATSHDAIEQAVAGFLGEQAPRVLIPRKVGLGVRDILLNQHRFEKTEGKRPLLFLKRQGFADAFEYFRFTSEATGEKRELRAWWKDFIKSHPQALHRKGEKQATKPSPPAPAARRKRRRRRTGPAKRNPGTKPGN